MKSILALCLGVVLAAQGTLPALPTRLLGPDDFINEGAFRLPAPLSPTQTFAYGGTALTYWPAHDSLLVVGHDWYQQVGEVSIPAPSLAATVAELPRAVLKQPLTDILQGKRLTTDGGTVNGVKIGGMLVVENRLIVSAWSYYDGGSPTQTKTHFYTGQDFASTDAATVKGPYQVGTGFQALGLNDVSRIGGFVSGYMAVIPPEWRSALGGSHLTGQGGAISVLNRTSSGPSATVFSPQTLGVKVPSPGQLVMGYPMSGSDPALNHPTLGVWGQEGGIYNGTQGFRGMIFPAGTRSVLFFGWGGTRFCYGAGTPDPVLDLKPVPAFPGTHYCYDPVPGGDSKGTHGYPLTSLVYAYDVNDFIAVKQGKKKPWEVVPYATWHFSLPFQSHVVEGVELGVFQIMGAAYDPTTQRVFLSAFKGDGTAPLIHVLRIR